MAQEKRSRLILPLKQTVKGARKVRAVTEIIKYSEAKACSAREENEEIGADDTYET